MKYGTAFGLFALAASAWPQTPCEKLAGLSLPNVKVTMAQLVGAGEFAMPPDPGGRGPNPAQIAALKALPAFCRVALTLTPTADSDIRSEVWLPALEDHARFSVAGGDKGQSSQVVDVATGDRRASNWNGRFQVGGNGGWAGNIGYQNLVQALADGYATAATDTGHTGGSASFAHGHPEKLLDFGWRAVHETTVAGKAIVKAFYGDGAKYSFFNGCSTGGRQALNAVQKFPADFNGVVAGAPVNPMTRLHAGSMYNTTFAHKDEARYIPPAKYPMIHKAAVEACDALDGLKDGLIENPLACHFDPGALECKGEDSPSCLTKPQVELARTIYAGSVNPRTKERIYPGWERGSELGWGVTAGPQPEASAIDTFRFVVFDNPEWDWHTLDFDADIALSDKRGNATINTVETNLKPFFDAGGKLLLFHGWSDPNVAPRNTIDYYNSVLKTMGGEAAVGNSVRLFMAPGMGHCGGGEGPNTFDKVAAVDAWLASGKAPDKIVATHSAGGKTDRSRPLCPFPQVARYKGSGNPDEAASFTCALPAPDRSSR